MILTIIIFILVLSLLVFVHEAGHFFTARGFGVKAEEFGMGLPPRAIGLQKFEGKWRLVKGNRELGPDEPLVYSLNYIPVGGFVKIKGENGEVYPIAEGATVQAGEAQAISAAVKADDSFGSKKIWQRIVILAAGVTMNVALCIILLAIGFMVGMPTSGGDAGGGHYVVPPQVQVVEVMPNYPAAGAGVQPGDIIAQVDGQGIANSGDLQLALKNKANLPVELKIKRGNSEITKSLTVITKDNLTGIGVAIADIGTVRFPIHLAIIQAVTATWIWFVMIMAAAGGLIMQLFGGGSAGVDFSGPVGIAVLTGQAAKLGWIYVLQFTAMLSLNLAIINILPFPALDGGRIVFLIVEKIRRKAVGAKIENFVHNLGFALLMLLIAAITYRDILKYGGQILGVLRRSVGL